VTRCGVHTGASGNFKSLNSTIALLTSSAYIPPYFEEDNADILIHDELKPAKKSSF